MSHPDHPTDDHDDDHLIDDEAEYYAESDTGADTDDWEDEPPSGPSKTQRKQAMHDLQQLGARLIEVNAKAYAAMHLPEDLVRALNDAKKIKANGAIRRQRQYIGKLMRQIDPAAIHAYFERVDGASSAHTSWLHQLERWRDRLLADDSALTEFMAEHPGADVQTLRTLIRNSRREQEQQKPPKSFRLLFQALKDIIPEPQLAMAAEADADAADATDSTD
jgi:ribosome-associated protein